MKILKILIWFLLSAKNYSPTDATQDMRATIDQRQYYPSICYSEEERPYLLTGTKTGYGAVGNANTSEVTIDGCVPSHFWLLARHGTRYPSSQAMGPMRNLLPKIQEQVLANHKAGRGHLCLDQVTFVTKIWKSWKPGGLRLPTGRTSG